MGPDVPALSGRVSDRRSKTLRRHATKATGRPYTSLTLQVWDEGEGRRSTGGADGDNWGDHVEEGEEEEDSRNWQSDAVVPSQDDVNAYEDSTTFLGDVVLHTNIRCSRRSS